jgi:hypothetical protein
MSDDKKRMNAMYLCDCLMAWFDVALLWGGVIFVFIAILGIVQDSNICLMRYISSFLLMLFNTASVFPMTKQFREDKAFIFGLDLKHPLVSKPLDSA